MMRNHFGELEVGSEILFDLNEKKHVEFYFADNADRTYLTEVRCMLS